MFIFTGINIKDPKPKKKLTGGEQMRGERGKKCLTMANLWQRTRCEEHHPGAEIHLDMRY
jgi:hypothetical protein